MFGKETRMSTDWKRSNFKMKCVTSANRTLLDPLEGWLKELPRKWRYFYKRGR